MSELELLEKRIKATALQDGVIAIVVFAMAVLVLLATATLASGGVTVRTGIMGAFGLLIGWAGWVMLQSARALSPAQASRIYRELAGDGQGLGWAHGTTGAFSGLKVYFLDGAMCTLYAGSRDVEALLTFVGQRAPRAVIGFGPEQEAAYVAMVKR